ncbi:UvrD-helicase domain-containing protein [Asticcacaulis sp. EMRT-3]|uniref:ATP-dependent helicase n=1 Tax=Asticcacaulis sp. EMRT-3 TaxID=3040349 RepID=UPI0024AEE8EA|nr:UvrD-helicase domain-containing protein [Asticcacaulis sp. EMRT-3]MDI7775258.1 UvrD-helicase domain-containing protein [Asticcacaulis sp. EMRT-3]
METSPPTVPNGPKLSELATARPDFFAGLNAEQEAAVRAVSGPVLVLAGAGTGKTRVLTTRIAHILALGLARPWEILCVTFTNKAAREMRERTLALVGASAEGLSSLGTFHSIAAQILRRHAELVGLKSSFTILDDDDQVRLLKGLFEQEGIDQKRFPPKLFAWHIDQWKNKGLTPDKVKSDEGTEFAGGRGVKLYRMYQDRLRILNACDFGDLLLHNLELLTKNPDILETYHRRFKYILVDEYQDTNVAQYLWLRLLTSASRNLCCVGDDDQSIYGWRGAEVDNILKFERDYPGAKIVRLERNYRSTQHILAAASGLIKANSARLGKTLFTDLKGGDKVQVQGLWDGAAEAQFVAEDIERQKKAGRAYADMAILVRASFQMRAFEERFVMLQIPYTVVGGPRFFERAEIRDALAYLRLIQSPDDDLAFERIINVPKRGIGDATVQKLLQQARLAGVSVMAGLRDLIETDELPSRAKTPLTGFLRDYDRWRERAADMAADVLLDMILTDTGYKDMQRADKVSGQTRLDNLKELGDSMQAFDDLAAFLEHVSLVMDLERDNGASSVRLMTLHAAKGLEFPVVYLPGWEEGVFPSQRSMDENGLRALEEERRLAYVGITRAREQARISFVSNRQVYGRWTNQLPSRFVDELPIENVEAVSQTGYQSSGWQSSGAGGQDRWSRENYAAGHQPNHARRPNSDEFGGHVSGVDMSRLTPKSTPHRPTPAPKPSAKNFQLGERVFHMKFGYGHITEQDGNKLVVHFETSGDKKVIDSFVERA